jgi:predicted permease
VTPSPNDRLYRALLRLFPREFRGDFGEQMLDDFRDQRSAARQDGGTARVLRLWIRTLGGALRQAPREHLESMARDLKYALRLLTRRRGFAAAIVLTLAVGVGSTTAVFTLADPMLFRPLPYPESDRLVEVYARAGASTLVFHVPDFLSAERTARSFEAIAAFGPADIGGRLRGSLEEPFGYDVTRQFFDVVRVRPFIGREFVDGEYTTGRPDAAILTYRFWQTTFGARTDILSQTFELQGRFGGRFRIVGVLPANFVLPDNVNEQPDFFVPWKPDEAKQSTPNHLVWPIARLARGATPEAAALELQVILDNVERDYPRFARNREPRIRSLREGLFGRVRTPLLMLLAATACVLLLACANLSHLFMAKLRERQREVAIRLAIGAGRGRVYRLLLVETAVLAVIGGVASLLFAHWTFGLIMGFTPEFAHVYRLLPARVDARVAAFAACGTAVSAVIFAAVPAWRATRLDVRESLVGGGTTSLHRRHGRSASILIVVQCATAFALLATGVLLVRSFYRLAYQPLGFEPQAVQTVYVERPDGNPTTLQERRRLSDHLSGRLRVPVALAGGLPAMTLPGAVRREGDAGNGPHPIAYPAGASFFDVFGVRLLRGRYYSDAEAFGNAPAAVVDRRAAEGLWPGQDPLGKVLVDFARTPRRVVGIVDTLRTSLTGNSSDGTAFIPVVAARSTSIVLRDPDRAVSLDELRSAAREIVPDAIVSMTPFRPFERTLGQPRFLAALLGTLGLLTLALTIVGVFGVVNHAVARRMQEMGIRIALGADPNAVRRLVVSRALLPAVTGVSFGAGVSLWWTRGLQSLLFDLKPHDVPTLAASGMLVLAVVLFASLVPAVRVSRIDPVKVLRSEG